MTLPRLLGEALISQLYFGHPRSRRLAESFFAPNEGLTTSSVWLVPVLRLCLFAVSLTFLANLVLLQGVEGTYRRYLSAANALQKVPLSAERGLILSGDGAVLAGNAPSFDLYYYPSLCQKSSCDWQFLKNFSFYSPGWAQTLARALETAVVRDLSQTEALDLEKAIVGRDFLEVKTGQKRIYPAGSTDFHLLGYVSQVSGEDLAVSPGLSPAQKIGRLGVEKVYDGFLKGVEGGRIFEVDALNHRSRLVREVPSRPGHNLVLNVQSGLQEVARRSLSEGVKNSRAAGGAVVAAEVQTGRLLALSSLPSLDPNIFSSPLSTEKFIQLRQDSSQPFFNRAAAGTFPPGSVFKLVVASGGLAEKVVNEKTLIEGPGSLSLGAFTFRDWKVEGHGRVDLVTALAESCDTCFYKIGGGYQGNHEDFKGLGPEKIAAWARLFGFGQTLGIDLPSESAGLVPDPDWKQRTKGERWFTGNTYNLAIGQGDLLVTPLQINSLTATVANGGRLLRPLLARKIVESDGGLVRDFAPEVLRQNFVEPRFLGIVMAGMRKAVQPGGTAYPFFNASYSLGGKTGTAETGSAQKTHAWFTAFAPFENPEIAVTVFLEEGGEGSRDAAPVAKKILDFYFSQK